MKYLFACPKLQHQKAHSSLFTNSTPAEITYISISSSKTARKHDEMPYPTHIRILDQTIDPYSTITDPAVLQVYDITRFRWDTTYAEYIQTQHAQDLATIFSQADDDWTIDQIVIAGLSYPQQVKLQQVAMIKHLARIFGQELGKPVKMMAQDDRQTAILQKDGPTICSAVETFLENLGIQTFQANPIHNERPAKRHISPTTLLFTPYLDSNVVLKLIDGTDPELFISVALDRIQTAIPLTPAEIKRIVDSFHENHVWKNAPIFDKQCCDTGELSGLSIYRRNAGGGSTGGTWTDEDLGDSMADKPKDWRKKCEKHQPKKANNNDGENGEEDEEDDDDEGEEEDGEDEEDEEEGGADGYENGDHRHYNDDDDNDDNDDDYQ